MKHQILLFSFVLMSVFASAQIYLSENEVDITFTRGPRKLYNWRSQTMVTYVNLLQDEMTLTVNTNTFRTTIDSLKRVRIFDTLNCPTISISFDIPFNQLDKESGARQPRELSGTLNACLKAYPVIMQGEFEFMDRHLLISVTGNLEASVLGIIVPRGMDNMVRFQCLGGKAIERR